MRGSQMEVQAVENLSKVETMVVHSVFQTVAMAAAFITLQITVKCFANLNEATRGKSSELGRGVAVA